MATLTKTLSSPLSILHLFANFKWTGPADPAIRTAAHLRRLGADVCFAEAAWTLPAAEHRMRTELRRWRLPVIAGLELRKHFDPGSVLRDVRRLTRRLARGEFDVVHTHLPADHLIGAPAAARCGRSVAVVRTLYDPDPPRRGWRPWLAFRRTDAVVAPTERCADAMRVRLGSARAHRVVVQEPTIEPRAADGPDLRERFGFDSNDVVIGITARVQPHRRFGLLWEAARRVIDQAPNTRFVLLGRGNDQDTRRLVREPIDRLGLGDHVAWPGYLYEPEYSAALRTLDVFLFLQPGSDGTCRAVREAMAFGLPIVAAARGMLPDIVGYGTEAAGRTFASEDPDRLAEVLLAFVRDATVREQYGATARRRARDAMDPAIAARRLEALYRSLTAR